MIIRNRYLFLADVAAVVLAYAIGFILRFDAVELGPTFVASLPLLPIVAFLKLAILYRAGMYRRVWRYATSSDVAMIGGAVTLGSLVFAGIVLAFGQPPFKVPFVEGFSRAIVAIDWLLSLLFVAGARFAAKSFEDGHHARERARRAGQVETRHVLVAGAGSAGVAIVKEMRANHDIGMKPIGFLDDDAYKHRLHILGLPVIGRCDEIAAVLASRRVDEVVVAMPSASGKLLRDITAACREAGVPCRTMPAVSELLDGRVTVRELREIRIEDLLRRDPVEFDTDRAAAAFGGRTVLVTGGGGSIGSELCRQVAAVGPGRLVVFGHGENSVFEAIRMLAARFPGVPVTPVIGSVTDRATVRALFRDHQPQVVFHAAAHKHVPLTETNPAEALRNNVFGTRIVAEESVRAGVQRFVLISTDKAVDPSNVLGATKRLAELVVRDLAALNQTVFVVVRFGNVLGSRGSLVPILRAQIAAGGPVTITHPDATRYFMTIPEAARLVLQAAALARGGEVFVLQMGEPVRIVDLARDVIRLSGLEPDEDIPIAYIGLRPGERLHEALFAEDEKLSATPVDGLMISEPPPVNAGALAATLETLEEAVEEADESIVRDLVMAAATELPVALPLDNVRQIVPTPSKLLTIWPRRNVASP